MTVLIGIPASGEQETRSPINGDVVKKLAAIGVRVLIQRGASTVHLQNTLAALHVGGRNHHLAVKAARAQQCGVKYIWAVSGGNKNYPFVGFKTIHFHQQLV